MPEITAARIWMIVCVAAGLWLAFVFQRPLLWALGLDWRPASLGQWGDTFGALNALFGAMGFAAVLYSLHHQGQALASQQADLNRQREDQHRQKFDATFFEVLNLIRSARDDFKIIINGNAQLTGHSAFSEIARTANKYFFRTTPKITQLDEVSSIYRTSIHTPNEQYLGPYFRLIFTILRRISEDKVLSDDDKIAYGNLVRAQLSIDELKILMLNGAMAESGTLSDYIKMFRMLRYLPEGDFRELAIVIHGSESVEPRND